MDNNNQPPLASSPVVVSPLTPPPKTADIKYTASTDAKTAPALATASAAAAYDEKPAADDKPTANWYRSAGNSPPPLSIDAKTAADEDVDAAVVGSSSSSGKPSTEFRIGRYRIDVTNLRLTAVMQLIVAAVRTMADAAGRLVTGYSAITGFVPSIGNTAAAVNRSAVNRSAVVDDPTQPLKQRLARFAVRCVAAPDVRAAISLIVSAYMLALIFNDLASVFVYCYPTIFAVWFIVAEKILSAVVYFAAGAWFFVCGAACYATLAILLLPAALVGAACLLCAVAAAENLRRAYASGNV
jgi:hypothetical protein